MDELLKAIIAKFNATGAATLKTACVGGMWLGMAPRGTAYPFITLTVIPSNMTYAMGSAAEISDAEIRFSIWDSSRAMASIIAILPLVKAQYDNTILTMTGYTNILAMRIGDGVSIEDEDRGWQWMLPYRYIYVK